MSWSPIPRADEVAAAANVRELVPPMPRRFESPHQPVPRTHLLSNGRYAVMITAAGSGYSRWRDLAVTRWQEDLPAIRWGSYIFLRDLRSGDVWSAGYQPTGVEPDSYERHSSRIAPKSSGVTARSRPDGDCGIAGRRR
jgi:cyclic beta-1,2-glucan synthetase